MYNEEVEKRMQEKKFDYQKLFLYLWILAVLIGFTALMVNNSNYEVVMIDETGFLLPNRIFEGMERIEGEGFSFSKSGECLEKTALGIVIAPTGEFSDKEIEAMYGSIG